MRKLSVKIRNFVAILSATIGCLWGGTQLVSHFLIKKEYSGFAEGSYFMYEEFPNRTFELIEFYRDFLIKSASIFSDEEILTDSFLVKLTSLASDNDYIIKETIEAINNGKVNIYNEMWMFTLKNTCNNTLEELKLILPFSGYYRLGLPEMLSYDETIKDYFTQFIYIGDLKPGEEAKIICWTLRGFNLTQINANKIVQKEAKFRHNKGSIAINYQVEASYLYIWNTRLFNIPLILGLVVLIPLLIYCGYALGKKKKEMT